MNSRESTICAIATPLGEGGVAIVRISGGKAIEVATTLFSKDVTSFSSHTAHYGAVLDEEGNRVDGALCLVMRAPASYTGEDVVELQCHGGRIAVQKVLHACLRAGASLATAGEFTYRAFLNGKIDLAQAESVQALIGAKSEAAYQQAKSHLEGRLSKKVTVFQKELIAIAAILEAWVDFPEEDLAYASFASLTMRLAVLQKEIAKLIATYEEGKRLEEGPKIALVGAPNAGKSSLMNALLDASRAIVTPKAGTTRDTIEANFVLGGRSLLLIDTAGLRSSTCEIEQLGIARSKEAMEEADLLVEVIDASKPAPQIIKKGLRVANKIDLAPAFTERVDVKVSALQKVGIAELKNKIEEKLAALYDGNKDALIISSYRHKEALLLTQEHITKVLMGLQKELSAEFITFDIKEALKALGTMIGQDVTEEILTSIFSQFCIGK